MNYKLQFAVTSEVASQSDNVFSRGNNSQHFQFKWSLLTSTAVILLLSHGQLQPLLTAHLHFSDTELLLQRFSVSNLVQLLLTAICCMQDDHI